MSNVIYLNNNHKYNNYIQQIKLNKIEQIEKNEKNGLVSASKMAEEIVKVIRQHSLF